MFLFPYFNDFLSPFKALFSDKSLKKDTIFFSILLILLPVALTTGPALPDIFLSLIAIFFLIKSSIKRIWSYYKNPIVIGFMLFSVYGVLRSLYYEFPIESLSREGSIFYFRYIFFAMGVWYLLDNNPYLLKCFLYISVSCILFVSIDSIFQYFNEVNFFGNKKWNPERLTGVFGDEPIVGRYISYLTILTFAVIYQIFKPTKKIILFSIGLMIIAEISTFISGERTPLFYLTLFTILIFIYMPYMRLYRIIGFIISLILIIAIIQLKPEAKNRIIDTTLHQISNTKLPFLPYSQHHEEHYISAIFMFMDYPFFGIGTNVFSFECDKSKYKVSYRSCSTHPHQYYIQVLAELGIFGFLFIFSFFLYLSWGLLKQFYLMIKKKYQQSMSFNKILFLISLFVYWWPIIPHMSLYNNWNNVLMMLSLGFYMKATYKKNNGDFAKID